MQTESPSRIGEIIEYIREHQGQSGIIYCSTKKNVDALYETLKEKGIAVGRYHAGLSNELRAMCQENSFMMKLML